MYLSKLVQRAPTTCFSRMIPDGEEGILTQLAGQLQVVAVSSWGCGPLIPFGALGSESLVLGCFPIIPPQPPLVLSSFLLEFSFQRSLKLLLGQLVLSKQVTSAAGHQRATSPTSVPWLRNPSALFGLV